MPVFQEKSPSRLTNLRSSRQFYYHTAAQLTTPDPGSAADAAEGAIASALPSSTVNPLPLGFHPAVAAGHYYDPYGPYLLPPGPQQPPHFAGLPIYKARARERATVNLLRAEMH